MGFSRQECWSGVPLPSLMTNLDSVLKSRDITLPTKVYTVKAMVFPVEVSRCENWTIKKAECRKTSALELWCWRRLMRVPWTARRSNQSILKEINPEYSLEGLALKLKLQYFGHWCKDRFIGKEPDAGKDWGQEEKRVTEEEIVGWHHWLVDMSYSKLWEIVKDREGWRGAIHGFTESQTWRLNNNQYKEKKFLLNSCE